MLLHKLFRKRIGAIVVSLQKAIHKTQAEILSLHNLKHILLELRHG